MDGGQRRGLQAAILAYGLWGLLSIYWRQLSGLDAVELIGWRVIAAGALMVVVLTLTGGWTRLLAALSDRRVLLRVAIAAMLLTANWTTYVWAATHDRLIETALGYFLAPLGTMALGVVVLGERLTTLKRMSIGFTLVAVVVLVAAYGRPPWVALILMCTWSTYGLAKRRVPLDPVESLTGELLVVTVPGLALISLGWIRATGIPDVATSTDWALIAGSGAITAIPLLLFAYAAQRLPFTVLGPTNYLVPLINFVLGWLVFGEELPLSGIVGFGLVWVALALATVDMFGPRARGTREAPVPVR